MAALWLSGSATISRLLIDIRIRFFVGVSSYRLSYVSRTIVITLIVSS